MIKELEIVSIKRDLTLQPRTALHQDWVEEYAHDMLGGAHMPPVVVFFDGADNWLADGFHRVYAAEAAGLLAISADIRDGSRRDALLFSVGANAVHGHRRTNEDKRRAVDTLLKDPEWSKWSDREIAKQCAVTHPFVSERRPQPSGNAYQISEPRRVTRNGTTYEMNTGRIGRPPKQDDEATERNNDTLDMGFDYTVRAGPAPAPSFDWEAANLRNRAMDAIDVLADMPPASEVIDAWMKTQGYGKPIERLEAAAEWLAEFIDLYRDAEPERWARIEKAAAKTRENEHVARQHH